MDLTQVKRGRELLRQADERASQDGAIRDRQVTLIEARDDGLSQLAHVLTEEQAAPGSITLSEAPILGDELIKVVEAGQDGSTKGGAYSVQELLEKVEEVMLQLRERFRQQEDRFRHRCLDLNFDEWVIEHEFRKLTFDGHRRYMYGLALGVMLYSFIAVLTYNVNDIVQLGEQNASSLKIELECLPASANLTANVTLPVSRRAQYDRLASALIFRAASGCLLVLLVLVLRCAPRKLALGAIVLVRDQTTRPRCMPHDGGAQPCNARTRRPSNQPLIRKLRTHMCGCLSPFGASASSSTWRCTTRTRSTIMPRASSQSRIRTCLRSSCSWLSTQTASLASPLRLRACAGGARYSCR